MKYAIEMGPLAALPVVGSSEQFPVGRIYCVGRNYADHAREMGHDPDREPPFFFMKPANAIVPNNSTIPFPQATKDLHHEIELVVALSKGGAEIPVEKALDHVWGYGVGLDMTRRDLQGEAVRAHVSPSAGRARCG
jgi:fumarylpyruvate hydrolase